MRRVCLPLRRIAVNGLLQGTRDSFPPTPASGRVSSPPPLLHLACFGVNPFAHLSRRHTIPCLSPQFFFGYPQTFIHLFSLFPQLFRQSPAWININASLRKGLRGLPGGSSLAVLNIGRKAGCAKHCKLVTTNQRPDLSLGR